MSHDQQRYRSRKHSEGKSTASPLQEAPSHHDTVDEIETISISNPGSAPGGAIDSNRQDHQDGGAQGGDPAWTRTRTEVMAELNKIGESAQRIEHLLAAAAIELGHRARAAYVKVEQWARTMQQHGSTR